ncbi:MAG: flagellar FlbD family protein [Planctomycetota bacterium]
MITVTRLNGDRIVVNAELIKTLEATPDTIITLINGDRLVVKEPVPSVIELAIDYGRRLRAYRPKD